MRIDAPETPNRMAMDDFRRARDELPAMARSLVEGAGREISRIFFDREVEPYLPCPINARLLS